MIISKNIAYSYVSAYANERGRGIEVEVRKTRDGVMVGDVGKGEGHKVDYKIKSTTNESPVVKTIFAIDFPRDKNAVYELFDQKEGLTAKYESEITGSSTISSQF